MVNETKIIYRKSIKTEDNKEILLTLGIAEKDEKYPKKAVIIISTREPNSNEVKKEFIMLEKYDLIDFIEKLKEVFKYD